MQDIPQGAIPNLQLLLLLTLNTAISITYNLHYHSIIPLVTQIYPYVFLKSSNNTRKTEQYTYSLCFIN